VIKYLDISIKVNVKSVKLSVNITLDMRIGQQRPAKDKGTAVFAACTVWECSKFLYPCQLHFRKYNAQIFRVNENGISVRYFVHFDEVDDSDALLEQRFSHYCPGHKSWIAATNGSCGLRGQKIRWRFNFCVHTNIVPPLKFELVR